MIITSITYKKYSSKCIVNFDNISHIEVSQDLILKYKLSKNKELNESDLTMIRNEQRIFDLKQAALHYASYKPRTEKQVNEKMKLKGFSEHEIIMAIKFLKEFNLLDDLKFAERFIADYIKRKPAGKQKLMLELQKRGIKRELAENAVNSNEIYSKEYELALLAARKKIKSLINKKPEKQRDALISFLARQGFEWGIIKNVLEEIKFDSTDDTNV